jgi:hypothetical protein
MNPESPKSKLTIRVQDKDKIANIAEWCADNLGKTEWDLEPVHLFKPDYKFHFTCEKIRIQVILQHL